MQQSPLLRATLVLVAVAAFLYVLSVVFRLVGFLFDVLLMLLAARIIASSIVRMANFIRQKLKVSFKWAVILAYLTVLFPIMLLVGVALPLAVAQAVTVANDLGTVTANVPEMLNTVQNLAARIGITVDLSQVYKQEMVDNASATAKAWLGGHAVSLAASTLTVVFNMLLIAIMSVWMVAEGPKLNSVFYRLLPKDWHDEAQYILATMDSIFQSWLKGVLVVGGIFGAATLVTMIALRLPYAIPVAAICGLLVIVPFIGDALAIGLPVVVALTTGSTTKALIVAVILVFVDFIVLNLFVSPKLMGKAVKLPIVMVTVGVLLGTKIAGPVGAFLGVPMAALFYACAMAFADRAQGRTKELVHPETEMPEQVVITSG